MAKQQTVYAPTLTQVVRAHLVELATHHQTTCYEELAQYINSLDIWTVPTSGNALGQSMSPILLEVLEWCKKRGWPPLTVLVVRKSGLDVGLPGAGFWKEMGSYFDPASLTRTQRVTFTEFFTAQVYRYFED